MPVISMAVRSLKEILMPIVLSIHGFLGVALAVALVFSGHRPAAQALIGKKDGFKWLTSIRVGRRLRKTERLSRKTGPIKRANKRLVW